MARKDPSFIPTHHFFSSHLWADCLFFPLQTLISLCELLRFKANTAKCEAIVTWHVYSGLPCTAVLLFMLTRLSRTTHQVSTELLLGNLISTQEASLQLKSLFSSSLNAKEKVQRLRNLWTTSKCKLCYGACVTHMTVFCLSLKL